jgi:hypothetical protein
MHLVMTKDGDTWTILVMHNLELPARRVTRRCIRAAVLATAGSRRHGPTLEEIMRAREPHAHFLGGRNVRRIKLRFKQGLEVQ